jgi:hypothetical protein
MTMYLRQVAAALAGALVLAGAIATDAMAQRRDRDDDRRSEREGRRGGFDPDWVLLGEKEVGFRVDRDVINVAHGEDWYRERRFRQLRFVADRNDVHMMSIRLVYHNGFGEDFRVDRLIRQGDSLPLDLRGERSFIRRIEMVYRSRPDFRGEAVIRVFGEPSRRGPPGPPPGPGPSAGGRDWVELGCQQVALLGKDRDSIRVGRREGRFKAIRLHVRGAGVEVLNLRVIYTNGEPDNLEVKHFIREGERTRPLDLKGWERSIDRIDMAYRTNLNPLEMVAKQRISSANVCVEGLQ